MKKIKILSLFVCLMMVATACGDDNDSPDLVATRTVLMYLVAENDISSDIYGNIASVEQGLSSVTSPGTFVIYWDGGVRESEFPVPTLFKYEVDGKGGVVKREVIKKYSSQNSVSNEVINQVLNDVKTYCPAERYGLVFGSHATGWLPVNPSKTRSFGDDSGYKIDIPNLAVALSQSKIHFDYILFDACLMSQVEVAYELRNVADYLVLSPAEVLSVGFPYATMTKYLLAMDATTEQSMKHVATAFIDYYKNSWGTVAVIKTAEMEGLANITHSIMTQHRNNLSVFDSSKINEFQKSYGFGRSVVASDYSSYDFRAFIRELTDGNIPAAFEEQLTKVVVSEAYVAKNPILLNIDAATYSGIGCYIPDNRFTKWNAYFKNLQWYYAVGWDQAGW